MNFVFQPTKEGGIHEALLNGPRRWVTTRRSRFQAERGRYRAVGLGGPNQFRLHAGLRRPAVEPRVLRLLGAIRRLTSPRVS